MMEARRVSLASDFYEGERDTGKGILGMNETARIGGQRLGFMNAMD